MILGKFITIKHCECFQISEKVMIIINKINRHLQFFIFIAVTVALYYSNFADLVQASLRDELYSHIFLIPFVCAYLIFLRRKDIYSEVRYSAIAGLTMMAVGLFIKAVAQGAAISQGDSLSLFTFSAVLLWVGGFVLFFGVPAARKATFPLLFLLFMMPIPQEAAAGIISVLQRGSAEVANGLFVLTGVPYLRDGFTFHLPTMSIEVAEQCSGIRSSLVLIIISVLSGHLFLKSKWKKFALIMAVFPITVFKNSVRIVTLTMLGAYVDESILSSNLHRRGGIPFFVLAMVLFMAVLWMLVSQERKMKVKSLYVGASREEKSE